MPTRICVFLPSGDFLEGTGDDEVGVIHGDKISGKLRGEMIFLIEVLPVDIRIRVFGFLEGMSDCALSDTQFVSEQRGDEVSLTVVSDDQIRFRLQLGGDFFGDILSESLDVWPHLKTRDPFAKNTFFVSEWNSKNMRVLCSEHLLKSLPAGGSDGVREEPCHLFIITSVKYRNF